MMKSIRERRGEKNRRTYVQIVQALLDLVSASFRGVTTGLHFRRYEDLFTRDSRLR